MNKIALVTGSNKGIGLSIVEDLLRRGVKTILTARSEQKGTHAVEKLKEKSLAPDFCALDVTNSDSIDQCFHYVSNKYSRIDILINNAGIISSEGRFSSANSSSFFETSEEEIMHVFKTNTVGSFLMIKKFASILNSNAHIINISSGMASLTNMSGGYLPYRLSKTALNALTKVCSQELSTKGVTVNSVSPGWVHTDMGGPHAPRSPEDSAKYIVDFALSKDAPNGKFVEDCQFIDW